MPQNCAFVNCAHSRRYPGISLFKIATVNPSDSEYTAVIKANERATWKNVILRTREETEELQEHFNQNNVSLSEKHFDPLLIPEFTSSDSSGKKRKVGKRYKLGQFRIAICPKKC